MAKKIEFKYAKKTFSNTLTYKLTMILDVVLTIFCILLVSLYVIGNYQNFQDNTQSIILVILSYTAVFTTMLSICLFVETIIKLFTEKRKFMHIINGIYLIISTILCILFSGMSNVISFLSMGLK